MMMCRACLATETNMIAMDVPFINYFNILTGLNVSMMDKCLYTCKACHKTVQLFIKFREKCIESDGSFHVIIVQDIKHEIDSPVRNDLVLIKDELKAEFDNSVHSEDMQKCNDDSSYCSKVEINSLSPHKSVTNVRRKMTDLTKNKVNRKKSKEKLQNEKQRKNISVENIIDSKLLCGLCDKTFDAITELSSHLTHHASGGSCGLCPERFANLPHLLAHRIDHLPAEQRVCHICSRKFNASTAINLEFHYMRVHGMAEKDAKIDCKQCKSSYINANKLIRHVRDCHSAFRYGCEICAKGFRNKTCLKIHLARHKQEKNINCDQCEFTSKYASSLLLHKRRKHTDTKVSCGRCARVFLDQDTLESHVNVCKGNACVVCTVCGKCIKKDWLNRHMRSHSDICRYKCAICPAQYKYRTGYKDHMAKHEGKMSYRCDLCPKSFCVKGSLTAHRRTHTGGKPYVCETCNTGFAKSYNLKVHMKVHGPRQTGLEQT